MKKYNITIEQPCIISLEIEADNIEQAEAIAVKKWNTVDKNDLEFGTEAQIQIESDDGTDSTDWHNLNY